MNKVASEEKLAFAARLIQSLRLAGVSVRPAHFVRDYNLRSEGNSITVFAARKWLLGESIPTQDRLRILSSWLNVQAQWLRYGEGPPPAPLDDDSIIPLFDYQVLVRDLKMLRPHSRRVVQGLVAVLLKTERT
jgi:hypothetical protein